MNLVGIFSFSVFTASLIILIIPFRNGESWTRWALPAILLPGGTFCTHILIHAHRAYNAPSPWILFVVLESFIVLGLIFSILDARQK
jgi:4-hydroxybenzoate polyprenyltransferase